MAREEEGGGRAGSGGPLLPGMTVVAAGRGSGCRCSCRTWQTKVIMYIYHALINALSAHMTHVNLNIIFYTHVEHSPTKTIYMKYTEKQTHILLTHKPQ